MKKTMTNKFDIEVSLLRQECETKLEELEDICNEIDYFIRNSDTRLLCVVCTSAIRHLFDGNSK